MLFTNFFDHIAQGHKTGRKKEPVVLKLLEAKSLFPLNVQAAFLVWDIVH